jgi:hypothetical protein
MNILYTAEVTVTGGRNGDGGEIVRGRGNGCLYKSRANTICQV